MLNEGLIVNDAPALVKSEIVKQIRRLGPTTPDALERAVFKALSGHDRDEVDWDVRDNQAGYYSWVRSFDQQISELAEDGYISVEDAEEGKKTLAPTDALPDIQFSHLAYPPGK